MNDDPYLEIIDSNWGHIIGVYETFRDKKPIIEYDITNQKIYSYPAKQYIQDLSRRTRKEARRQYKETLEKNQFMLFIKDYENEKLRSYIFSLPPAE